VKVKTQQPSFDSVIRLSQYFIHRAEVIGWLNSIIVRELLDNFYLNDYNLGFHLQIQKLSSHFVRVQNNKQTTQKNRLIGFH